VVIGSEAEETEVGIVSGACADFDVCTERAAVIIKANLERVREELIDGTYHKPQERV
jgi:hypothetical protein